MKEFMVDEKDERDNKTFSHQRTAISIAGGIHTFQGKALAGMSSLTSPECGITRFCKLDTETVTGGGPMDKFLAINNLNQ
jgi:hypothetical protein